MKKRVMVVDDSCFVLEEMKQFLADSDYEIVAYCKSGEEACERYKEISPDVVTLDIIMPGIDGLETAELLKKLDANVRIIIVSSLAYDDTFDSAKHLGIRHFIFKPVEHAQLIAALDEVCAQ